MRWKLVKTINHGSSSIPKGSILTQVKKLDIELSTNSTLNALYKMHPRKNLVVLDFNNEQHIFEVGKDVIPYGRGVR